MVAEQSTQSRYRPSPSRPEREIDLTVRIETAGDPGVDVDTVLLYDPLPPAWDDPIAHHLYDGVHAGLAAVGVPLPDDGIRVTIGGLRISPPLGDVADPAAVLAIGETIRLTVASIVETLWRGLRQASPADQQETPRRIPPRRLSQNR